MTLNYTLAIILTCTLSIIHAADEADDLPEIFTFRVSMNDAPPALHNIDTDQIEIFSGEKFKTLFDRNARAKHLPWLIAPIMTHNLDNSPNYNYCDIIELIKKQPHIKMDFSSHASSCKLLTSLFNSQTVQQQYPNDISFMHYCFYYPQKDYVQPISITAEFDHKGKKISISDLSCTLAIALRNDYSQLLPMISMLLAKKHLAPPIAEDRINFWNKTFFELPAQQRNKLLKKLKKRFGVKLYSIEQQEEQC